MHEEQRITEAGTAGMNMAEHHAEELRWCGKGAETSALTPKGRMRRLLARVRMFFVRLAIRLAAVGKVLPGAFVVELRDAAGCLKGRDVFTSSALFNALTDEGANLLFAILFGATAKVSNWYFLLTTAAPSAGSTLASISECASGNQPGYARSSAITWDFATSRHAKTGNKVFTATAAWTAGATHMCLCTAASGTSGTLFNYLALSATRQPAANGDTITVSWDGSL